METRHSKHTGLTPVTLLSADYTGQQLGLCQWTHKSVEPRCKQSLIPVFSETIKDLRRGSELKTDLLFLLGGFNNTQKVLN